MNPAIRVQIPAGAFCQSYQTYHVGKKSSLTGSWTRVSRVRAVYPDHLDYRGLLAESNQLPNTGSIVHGAGSVARPVTHAGAKPKRSDHQCLSLPPYRAIGFVRSKNVVNSGNHSKVWLSRLIISGAPPQAGNGAGKTCSRGQSEDCRAMRWED